MKQEKDIIDFDQIIALNPGVDIKKVKEINEYMKEIKPYIHKEEYTIGTIDTIDMQRAKGFCCFETKGFLNNKKY